MIEVICTWREIYFELANENDIIQCAAKFRLISDGGAKMGAVHCFWCRPKVV